ncbi:conserved hypothetical protein [Ricinus communis]|uniref:Uncharacterized protein n=1 Tax=Ricinus communis TaxID=3988 RepID=B9S5E3_RICCO|nr:conserved hypothetical protein [Ricinus communis]
MENILLGVVSEEGKEDVAAEESVTILTIDETKTRLLQREEWTMALQNEKLEKSSNESLNLIEGKIDGEFGDVEESFKS